jgi:hypothetical protein
MAAIRIIGKNTSMQALAVHHENGHGIAERERCSHSRISGKKSQCVGREKENMSTARKLTKWILIMAFCGTGIIYPRQPVHATATPSLLRASDLVLVFATNTVAANSFGSVDMDCPAPLIAIGGGLETNDHENVAITASAPRFPGTGNRRLIDEPSGLAPNPTGWQASARNWTNVPEKIKGYAMCAPLDAVTTTYVSATVNIGPQNTNGAGLVCPNQLTALTGGVDVSNVNTLTINNSEPLFPAGNIFTLDQGDNGAPDGWSADVANLTSGTGHAKIAVVCASLPGAVGMINETTLPPQQVTTYLGSNCPANTVSNSGGIITDDGSGLISSSAPFFFDNHHMPQTIWNRPVNATTLPGGWFASPLEHSAQTVKMITVTECIPIALTMYLPFVIH